MFRRQKISYKIYQARELGFEGLALRVLQKTWDDKFIKIIKQNSIHNLVLIWGGEEGLEQEDLQFFRDLSGLGLKSIVIRHYGRLDISPLKYLEDLEGIYLIDVEYSRCPDLSKFKNLKSFSVKYKPSAKTIFNCPWLKTLNIYSFPHLDLQVLSQFSQLEHLTISTRKIESLTGVENLRALKTLDIHYASKLKNLDGIELCPELESVVAFRCGELHGLEKYGSLVDTRNGMS